MTYGGDNRLLTQTDSNGLTLTYSYDANGNVVKVVDSLGGVTTSTYDGNNQLISQLFTGPHHENLSVSLTRDGNGNIVTESRFADAAGKKLIGTTINSYDAANRLIHIQHRDGHGQLLEEFAYSYDAGGRLTAETDNGVTTNYTYDSTDQLLTFGKQTNSYDVAGNRANPGYDTGPGNRLLSDDTWNYSYDNEGNTIGKVNVQTGESWTYGYNNANQMTSAEQRDAKGKVLMHAEYTYDVFGNRIESSVTTGHKTDVTRFAYNGTAIWADLSAKGKLETRYLRDDLGNLLARVDAHGKIDWYLTDHLGSVRGITNAHGKLIDQIDYDAFGNVTRETNPKATGRFTYTGLEHDTETGLYRSQSGRMYDPATGRWLGEDYSGFDGGDSNLNRYVGNAPTGMTDPSGLAGVPPAKQLSPAELKALMDRFVADVQKKSEGCAPCVVRLPKPLPPEEFKRVQEKMAAVKESVFWAGVAGFNEANYLGDNAIAGGKGIIGIVGHTVTGSYEFATTRQTTEWQKGGGIVLAPFQQAVIGEEKLRTGEVTFGQAGQHLLENKEEVGAQAFLIVLMSQRGNRLTPATRNYFGQGQTVTPPVIPLPEGPPGLSSVFGRPAVVPPPVKFNPFPEAFPASNVLSVLRFNPFPEGFAAPKGPVHLDIGGEGRYPGAINVNPGYYPSPKLPVATSGEPIPNLVKAPSHVGPTKGQLPFASQSADLITVENSPLYPQTVSEVARVIKPGGEIRLVGPADYARTMHQQVIQALPKGSTVTQTTVGTGDAAVTTTIIKVPGGQP